MLYGGIKIEAERSIIVIVDEQNKLFIQHDIVIDNTESGIKNYLGSMQQGGIKPTDICFAISPGHIKNAPAFKLLMRLWQSAGYELRLINNVSPTFCGVVAPPTLFVVDFALLFFVVCYNTMCGHTYNKFCGFALTNFVLDKFSHI